MFIDYDYYSMLYFINIFQKVAFLLFLLNIKHILDTHLACTCPYNEIYSTLIILTR